MAAASPTFSEVLRVTSLMTAPRAAFRDFFDAYLREDPTDVGSPPRSFLHALFTQERILKAKSPGVGVDPTQPSHAAALGLLALGGGDAAARCMSAMIAAGLFDPVADDPEDKDGPRAAAAKAARV